MGMHRLLKWSFRALAVATLILLFTASTVGILLLAIDIPLYVVSEMHKTACDRRQMHHMSLNHRL